MVFYFGTVHKNTMGISDDIIIYRGICLSFQSLFVQSIHKYPLQYAR